MLLCKDKRYWCLPELGLWLRTKMWSKFRFALGSCFGIRELQLFYFIISPSKGFNQSENIWQVPTFFLKLRFRTEMWTEIRLDFGFGFVCAVNGKGPGKATEMKQSQYKVPARMAWHDCVWLKLLIVIVGADKQLTFALCSLTDAFQRVINRRHCHGSWMSRCSLRTRGCPSIRQGGSTRWQMLDGWWH